MVNQLIEMTKCMEKGLSDYKTHNSQGKQFLFKVLYRLAE